MLRAWGIQLWLWRGYMTKSWREPPLPVWPVRKIFVGFSTFAVPQPSTRLAIPLTANARLHLLQMWATIK